MTREEQIRQASIEYTIGTRPMCIGGGVFSELIDEMNRCKPFEDGAKWADETMIEKACKWLTQQEEMIGVSFEEDFIERFKKAMEL